MNIREVWDHRLSTCTPLIVREGGTWVCQVWPKVQEEPRPSEEFDTGMPIDFGYDVYGDDDVYVEHNVGDEHDAGKLKVCADWFKSVSDKYPSSTHNHLILRYSETWVCQIWPKEPVVTPPVLEHDTGIRAEVGDAHDVDKLKVCHEWFKSVRDQFSLPNIEDLKPRIVEIQAIESAEAERLDTSQYTHMPVIMLDDKAGVFLCQIWTKDEQGNPKDLLQESDPLRNRERTFISKAWFYTRHESYDFPDSLANIPVIPFKQ